jgi:hypothetical protein
LGSSFKVGDLLCHLGDIALCWYSPESEAPSKMDQICQQSKYIEAKILFILYLSGDFTFFFVNYGRQFMKSSGFFMISQIMRNWLVTSPTSALLLHH